MARAPAPGRTRAAIKILAISGSLRAASINSAFLRAAARLAPAGVEVEFCTQVAALPLFNPDLEAQPPAAVAQFRGAVAAADALLLASPEYAHGVSGVMKNALDWLVSFEPFVDKPVAIVDTSPRAHYAAASLREILKTMSAFIVEPACLSVALLGGGDRENDDAAIARTAGELFRALLQTAGLARC